MRRASSPPFSFGVSFGGAAGRGINRKETMRAANIAH
jgi:hypothetical protein